MAPPFLNSVLDEGELSAARPGHFTPRERALGTHHVGGWVGLEPVWTLWSKGKSLVPAGNRTPAVKPVARRYIN
jgi:hypothetical protein